MATEECFITHNKSGVLDIASHQKRLKATKNLALPLEEELHLLNQLTEFELGRSLLAKKGLEAYWISYSIVQGPYLQLSHPLENWIIHKAPVFKSTQERFRIFQDQLKSYVKSEMTVASVPCGLMDVSLSLDFSHLENVKLVGIDLDKDTLNLANKNAEKNNKTSITSFLRQDAWNLEIDEKYDILISNGLNIYEHDDQKVVELYKEFFKALKSDGILILSFLTPPPSLSKESSWKNYNLEDALKQKAVFGDIIQAQWQASRTENQTREQLKAAGFKVLKVIYDSQGMFPTIIGQK